MQLSDLQTQFTSLMNRSDLKNNASLQTTFINQAIMRLQRELRLPFMEKTIEYTVDGNWPGYLGIPSDLLELIIINIDSDGDGVVDYPLQRVNFKDVQTYSEAFYNGAAPMVYCRKGARWLIGPMPGLGAPIEVIYYAEFAPLVNPTDVNTISKVAWDAVVYGALSAACDYYMDERAEGFEKRYQQITKDLQSQADDDELTADAAVKPALRFDDDMYYGY